MKAYIKIPLLWLGYIILDWIALDIINAFKKEDNELAVAFYYIEVPLSLIVCLICLIVATNLRLRNDKKILVYVGLFLLLLLFNLYFFPYRKQ
jgi:hypothetical protein